jgi:hypothetical protein
MIHPMHAYARALGIIGIVAACAAAQTAFTPLVAPPPPELKFLEAATSMSNTITSWAYALMAGSILVLVGTSYYRPANRWIRGAYFTFLPAWIFLFLSIQAGAKLQGYYLGVLFAKKPDFDKALINVNDQAVAQTDLMRAALLCLGTWLIIYLFWWILNNEPKESSK